MKRLILICLPLILLAGACKNKKATDMQPENPFFTAFDTPYGVPAFDKIKNEHYLPAFKEGIKRQEQEIKAITDNKEAPDFENTILALDQSGEMLTTVSSVFFNLLSAVSSDSLQAIAKEVTPLVTDHQNNIMLNEDLFKRVKAVYDSRLEAGLSPDRIRVICIPKEHEGHIFSFHCLLL